MRPGTNITTGSQPTNAAAPTKTGTWMVVVQSLSGPTTPTLITSFEQYQKVYGAPGTAYATFSTAVETFFIEGGSRLLVVRVVGPLAKTAELALNDSEAKPAVTIKALSPGTWGNAYKIAVTTAEEKSVIKVETEGGEVLETSPSLASLTEIVTWCANFSSYIRATITGTKMPATAASKALASGTDDNAKITNTQYLAGMELFTREYGPGQLSVPGVTTEQTHKSLFEVAAKYERVALCDTPDTTEASELESQATPIRALANNVARAGCLCAPWVDVPSLTGTILPRACPPSAIFAAKISETDERANPNQPAAGQWGKCPAVLKLHATYTDAQREAINKSGVNVIKLVYGQPRIYGFRTATKEEDFLYIQLNNVRLDMAFSYRAAAILEEFFGSDIDGRGVDIAEFGNRLKNLCAEFYTQGALYGNSPEEAYTVNTLAVNNATTAEHGEIFANVGLKRSKFAEQVNLAITRIPITGVI